MNLIVKEFIGLFSFSIKLFLFSSLSFSFRYLFLTYLFLRHSLPTFYNVYFSHSCSFFSSVSIPLQRRDQSLFIVEWVCKKFQSMKSNTPFLCVCMGSARFSSNPRVNRNPQVSAGSADCGI